MDLSMPSDLNDRRGRWEEVTAGTAFFDSVSAAVVAGNSPGLRSATDALAGWASWFRTLTGVASAPRRRKAISTSSDPRLDPETLSNWSGQAVRARALVWCALQAIAERERLSRTLSALEWFRQTLTARADSDLQLFLEEPQHRDWLWISIRTLLNADSREIRETVAFYDEEAALERALKGRAGDENDLEEGVLATLVIERIGTDEGQSAKESGRLAGVGHVAHHPIDLFLWRDYRDKDLHQGFKNAWNAAQLLYQERNSQHQLYDARWRLIDVPKKVPILGASASGTAARGFYLALEGKVEDPEVVTFAEVDADDLRMLNGVDGVVQKTRAVARDARFDTIAVATEENRTQAIAGCGTRDGLRVVNFSELNQL